jgi:hypothetical protein
MRTSNTVTRETESKVGALSIPLNQTRLIQASCIYIALAATLRGYVVVEFGPITIGLLLAIAVATIGWRRMPAGVDVKRYLIAASLFSAWVVVSAIASWITPVMFDAAIDGLWMVFLIPGLASVMRWDAFRHAFVAGWAAGAGYFTLTAVYRYATGRSVFDAGGGNDALINGEIRGGVNTVVLVIVPFLLMSDCGRYTRFFRWPLAASMMFWVVQSGGRSGFLGLGVALLVLALARPGASHRLRALIVIVLIGFVAMSLIQASGGQASESTGRLTALFRGERTDSDDARELLLRKAWHLAVEHPFFGVGLGRFQFVHHPVVDEAETPRAHEIALTYQEHNTFAGVMAETGYPGLFAFLAFCGVVTLASAKRIGDRRGRAAIASLAALFFTSAFHSSAGPRLFLPIALALAAAIGGARAGPATDRDEPSTLGRGLVPVFHRAPAER